LEVDLLEIRGKYVHLGAIRENASVVQMLAGSLGALAALHFNEGLPNLSLLEDEYSLHFPMLREQFIEEIMSDQTPRFVVDTNQQDGGRTLFVLLLHQKQVILWLSMSSSTYSRNSMKSVVQHK
jgi:hypothetical protein